MKLRNDKILILGGGSGIGKAIAKRFCDAGAKVLITGRNEEKLKNAVIAVKKLNIAPEIIAKEFDIDLEILKIESKLAKLRNDLEAIKSEKETALKKHSFFG